MIGVSTQIPKPVVAPSAVDRVTAACKRSVNRIPPKARLASLIGALVLVALAIYTLLSGGTATLVLNCRHDLRSADLSVSIDDKVTYTDHISADSKKRFLFFGQTIETFSKSLTVPAGEHFLQVHLTSAADGLNQTRQCKFDLAPGSKATLQIAAKKKGLLLEYQGPQGAAEKKFGLSYFDYLRAILSTIVGSAVSAFIGFMVQEFLRAKKPA
jgi:hypothetical protein